MVAITSVSFGECHLSCLLDTENGMVCNACKSSQNQIIVDGDSEDKTDDECHSDSKTHDKTESDILLATQRTENSLEQCLSHTYSTEKQSKSCQTEGVSLVDFHKKQKELNLKEKAVNKKEFELSQTSKQLITARAKIIALEKTVNELQKENDLLRTNLLLAQTSSSKKEEDGNRPAYQMQYCSGVCNNKLLEQRVSMLEHEQLKKRIERLEANNINSSVKSSEQTEEKVIKGNLAKLLEAQHVMMNAVQTVLSRQSSETDVFNSKQSEINPKVVSSPIDLTKDHKLTTNLNETATLDNVKGVGMYQQLGNESQQTVVIIDDEAQSQREESRNAPQQGGGECAEGNLDSSRKGTPSVQAVEGVPIQYHATSVPHPFLYPAWTQHVPPWMGQQTTARFRGTI